MMKGLFDVEAFTNLPGGLRPSDYVDFLLFLSSKKPVVRLGKNGEKVYSSVVAWCKTYNIRYYISAERYMYVSKRFLLPWITSVVDDLPVPHAILLGKLFGYPHCCTQKISQLGEDLIDEWELTEFADEDLVGDYRLIDPKLYRKGVALISHVPCSNKCDASLQIAKDVYQIIAKHRDLPCMENWLSHFKN